MKKVSIKAAARTALRDDKKVRKAAYDAKHPRAKGKQADSFVNFAQSLGIGADTPLSTASYGFNPISRIPIKLEFIHRGSWLGAMAVDLKADDMTRSGVEIQGKMSPEDMNKIESEIRRLGVWGKLCSLVKWAKLYGGAIAYIMTDQDPATPLRLDAIAKGGFKGLIVYDRWMIDPSLNDLVTEEGADIGLPKFYRVMTGAAALPGVKIHHSRVIRLVGIEMPYRQAITENLWGISVLERVYDRMVAFDSATTGAAQLVYKAYLRTLKIKGLREIISAGGRAYQGLLQQVELMRKFQNIEGISLLDDEDTMEAQSHSAFAGLSDALAQFGQQFSGAVQIPQMRLFGQSPAGFNAGDNDLRMYYDTIKQEQDKDLRPGVTKIYKVASYSLGIQPGEDFDIEFRSLWQATEKEKAEVSETITRSVTGALQEGIISPQTAARELKQSSKETGVFTNITDKEIATLEEEPIPPVDPLALAEAGGAPGAGGEPGKPAAVPGTKPAVGTKAGASDANQVKYKGFLITEMLVAGKLRWYYQSNYNSGGSAETLAEAKKKVDAIPPEHNRPQDSIGAVGAMKRIHDLDIVVENTKDSHRIGANWETVMPANYGYIMGTVAEDGDCLDCFVGDVHDSSIVWVIKQLVPQTGKLDEHKCMVGYNSLKSALSDYLKGFTDGSGWQRLGGIAQMGMNEFKDWAKTTYGRAA